MYILPQVQVFQEFSMLPAAVVKNLNAFVFGPNYQLFRYSEAAEKALTGLGAYDKDNDTEYAWPNQPAGSSVDLDYVKLYMEDVWAQYLQIQVNTAAPLIMADANQRNKLRAAPIISSMSNYITTASTLEAGGYFTGEVGLPEYYYFYPTGTLSTEFEVGTVDVVLAYVTTEGLTGTVSIPSAANPLDSGTRIAGPDGIVLDVDAGSVDDRWSSLKEVVIGDATGALSTSYFTITPNLDAIKTVIDSSIDDAVPLTVTATDTGGSGGVVVAFDPAVSLDLSLGVEVGVSTLQEVYTALTTGVYAADLAVYFTISLIEGTASDTVTDVAVGESTIIAGGAEDLVPVSFRCSVTPNPYLFSTGNGYTASFHFKSRGVRVGDRVRYSVTDDDGASHTGTTKVTGFEADTTLAVVAQPVAKVTNQATQVGSVLVQADGATAGGDGAVVVAGSDNQRSFDGVDTVVMALSGTKFSGELSQGVVSDSYTVTITTGGAAGTAKATVANAAGTYYRTGVSIEVAGVDAGQIYIGNNLVINFAQGAGDADAVFQVGDTYTFASDLTAPFTAVAGLSMVESSGVYTGPSDTTYIVEVILGGVFDRNVTAANGLQVPAVSTVFTPSVAWSGWSGGDVDDEYILKCTSAGGLTTAVFTLSSLGGDAETGIKFSATATDVTLGGRGLAGQFSVDVAFTVGDYWVIKVNATRPRVRITDSAGVDQGTYTVVDNGVDFDLGGYGAGLQFKANANTENEHSSNGGLLTGDVFFVTATASVDGALRTLILADDLPSAGTAGLTSGGVSNDDPNEFGIWLYLTKSAIEITDKKVQSAPDYNWVGTAAGITVNQDIAVQDVTWYDGDGTLPYLPVYQASLYAEYRALLTGYSSTIYSMLDISDIETTLGTVSPDNPLAQGVYNALSNSGNRAVYYMAVPSDDAAGYATVLDRATLNESVYAFAPLTRDAGIINSVAAHVAAMSSETNKRWRIAFVGTDMATEAVVYARSTNPGDTEFFCTIADDPSVVGAQYTVVTLVDGNGDPNPYAEAGNDVAVGDKIRVNYATDAWGTPTYEEYTVVSVDSNTQLRLVSGPASPVTIPTKAEIWHGYTVNEMADAVAAVSSAFASRRMYHIFPDTLGAFGVSQTSEFGAASVAGLCSSVAPQQGLTNIELSGFNDLPMVYSTFSRTQLNTMAESGTMIIMQDVAGGRIYIRHQVSTNAAGGDINQTELSVTKNLDSISYYFTERLVPYIGRYNVTPELLEVLRVQIKDGLYYLGSLTDVGLLGPQIMLENSQLRTLEQHPTLRDHVSATVDIELPYPLNVMQLHLVV